MSCEVPVIATNWSGPTAYLTSANGYPISILPNLIPAGNTIWGKNGHLWAQPNITHLRILMREIHNNHDQAKYKGKLARNDMIEMYSLTKMGDEIQSHVERIRKSTLFQKRIKDNFESLFNNNNHEL